MLSSKVLLIDDDPVVTGVYQGLFSAAGYQVEVATDGEAGLEAVRHDEPQAVLLDLAMPKLNGLQWLENIRRDARFLALPVVVFTAGTIAWQLTAARNGKATMILSKRDANPEKVVQAVKNAITVGGWSV